MGVVKETLLHFFYAPKCLHCQESLEDITLHLCGCCQENLTLASIADRCPRCFSTEGWGANRCQTCRKLSPPWVKGASAFEDIGPVQSLLRGLKEGNQPYLAKSLASFMVAQWARLEWPLPDVIVPVPQPWLRHLARGYNPSALMAQEMALLMGSTYLNALGYSFGEEEPFFLKKGKEVGQKKVLLIDDAWGTGALLKEAAKELLLADPQVLFVMTTCKS